MWCRDLKYQFLSAVDFMTTFCLLCDYVKCNTQMFPRVVGRGMIARSLVCRCRSGWIVGVAEEELAAPYRCHNLQYWYVDT
jgi:hypothetical protein